MQARTLPHVGMVNTWLVAQTGEVNPVVRLRVIHGTYGRFQLRDSRAGSTMWRPANRKIHNLITVVVVPARVVAFLPKNLCRNEFPCVISRSASAFVRISRPS